MINETDKHRVNKSSIQTSLLWFLRIGSWFKMNGTAFGIPTQVTPFYCS